MEAALEIYDRDVAPVGNLVDFGDGKVTRVTSHLDPDEALQAAGLRGW